MKRKRIRSGVRVSLDDETVELVESFRGKSEIFALRVLKAIPTLFITVILSALAGVLVGSVNQEFQQITEFKKMQIDTLKNIPGQLLEIDICRNTLYAHILDFQESIHLSNNKFISSDYKNAITKCHNKASSLPIVIGLPLGTDFKSDCFLKAISYIKKQVGSARSIFNQSGERFDNFIEKTLNKFDHDWTECRDDAYSKAASITKEVLDPGSIKTPADYFWRTIASFLL